MSFRFRFLGRRSGTIPARVLADETRKTERVINAFRAALWIVVGGITLVAEIQVSGTISIGAATALGWGLAAAAIEMAWLRRGRLGWLPWFLTTLDISVLGLCMISGHRFSLVYAPAVVPHQVYGSGFVMLVIVASNMLRFSPWISVWSTAYAAAVYFTLLHFTLGLDGLAVVEAVLVATLGAMLLYSARKLYAIIGAIQERELQLRQAQKMEAVGQITGGLAHDFNNLLTVIMGNSELLLDARTPAGDRGMLAQAIALAAERGAVLTRRLLAYSRRQTLEETEVELNQLVAAMGSILVRMLGEDIEIEIVPGEDIWPTLADASQVETALLNLAVNARDAMPSGGRLVVETRNVHLEQPLPPDLAGIASGDFVALTVTDTGTGMTREVIDRAFDPFFTTKEVGKGSGLGLSMVYGFVKQSGGYVKIYSEVGHGTSVRIYLPRYVGPSRRPAEELPRPLTIPSGTESILVVEDDELVRNHAVEALSSLGYKVVSANDGRSALQHLSGKAPVHLLFTDIVMPGGMNGRQLAEAALRQGPSLRVLFTSGYSETVLRQQGLRQSGVLVLPKPYHRHELAMAVRRELDRKLPLPDSAAAGTEPHPPV